jgi:hypothetical protein
MGAAVEDGGTEGAIASVRHEVAKAIMWLELAGNDAEHTVLDRIRGGFRDAGTDLKDW